MSKEARGEKLSTEVGVEPTSVVCRASLSTVRMCLVCARVCSGLSNQIIPEISDQSISHEKDLPLHPLDRNDLVYNNFDSFTMPTEVEIKDKGKNNSFAKSIVLFQTSW